MKMSQLHSWNYSRLTEFQKFGIGASLKFMFYDEEKFFCVLIYFLLRYKYI